MSNEIEIYSGGTDDIAKLKEWCEEQLKQGNNSFRVDIDYWSLEEDTSAQSVKLIAYHDKDKV